MSHRSEMTLNYRVIVERNLNTPNGMVGQQAQNNVGVPKVWLFYLFMNESCNLMTYPLTSDRMPRQHLITKSKLNFQLPNTYPHTLPL